MSGPAVDSIWAGGGMLVRILEVHDDGVSALVLTGRGRLLKRPRTRGFIPLAAFTDGRMKPSALPAVSVVAGRPRVPQRKAKTP